MAQREIARIAHLAIEDESCIGAQIDFAPHELKGQVLQHLHDDAVADYAVAVARNHPDIAARATLAGGATCGDELLGRTPPTCPPGIFLEGNIPIRLAVPDSGRDGFHPGHLFMSNRVAHHGTVGRAGCFKNAITEAVIEIHGPGGNRILGHPLEPNVLV